MLHHLELQWIHLIHQYRTPWLDAFFKFLNYFDRHEFFFVLIPFIWLSYGWKSGLRLFYILVLNSAVNISLKYLFHAPRPYQIEPELGLLQIRGFGFPSGAAQTVILLSGILLYNWKNSWKWVVAFLYVTFISFSRIYLGVHFFTDILGGWAVGLLMLAVYIYLFPPIEARLNQLSSHTLFFLSIAIPLILIWIFPFAYTVRLASLAIGLSIGLYISYLFQLHLPPPSSYTEAILRGIVGVLGAFGCLFLISFSSTSLTEIALQLLLVGLWLSPGSYFVCSRFRNTNA